jgi:hypothetical protein
MYEENSSDDEAGSDGSYDAEENSSDGGEDSDEEDVPIIPLNHNLTVEEMAEVLTPPPPLSLSLPPSLPDKTVTVQFDRRRSDKGTVLGFLNSILRSRIGIGIHTVAGGGGYSPTMRATNSTPLGCPASSPFAIINYAIPRKAVTTCKNLNSNPFHAWP